MLISPLLCCTLLCYFQSRPKTKLFKLSYPNSPLVPQQTTPSSLIVTVAPCFLLGLTFLDSNLAPEWTKQLSWTQFDIALLNNLVSLICFCVVLRNVEESDYILLAGTNAIDCLGCYSNKSMDLRWFHLGTTFQLKKTPDKS